MDTAALYAWLHDPQRTLEELFFAELLIEAAEDKYPYTEDEDFSTRYEKTRAKARRRSLDPAYRPSLPRKRIENAGPHIKKLTHLHPPCFYNNDRHLADLSALRFCPTVKNLSLHSRLRDLSGLLALPALESLTLFDRDVCDLSALGRLPHLRSLSLYLHHPWPGPVGLEALDSCTSVSLHLNLLILEGIPAWPKAEQVTLTSGNLPLRNLRRLPAMPAVKHLKVETVSLDGIGRYATVEHLELAGIFEDLSPLAGLPHLIELTLSGERFKDLSPLARLPSLRRLKLEREHGLLLDPLLEAPRLRVVEAKRCRVIATELASLNAAIGWQREDFVLDTPRPQMPLRLMRYDCSHPDADAASAVPAPPDGRELVAQGDETFAEAEATWIVARLKKALDENLGSGWGGVKVFGSSGSPYIAFFRDRERHAAWATLELLRSILADARYPWELQIAFDENEEDDEVWQERPSSFDEDGLYIESPEEREEDRQRARDHSALIEREHQLRLGEQGIPVPQHLYPAGDEEISAPVPEQKIEADDSAPSSYDPPTELRLTLTPECAWVTAVWDEAASAILGREPEDWHTLPEPPEKRPRPA